MVQQKTAKKTKAAKNDTASKPKPSIALRERLRRKGYKSDLPGVEKRDKVEWHTLLRETLPDALPQTKQRQPVLVGGTTIEKIIESANAFAEAPRAPPTVRGAPAACSANTSPFATPNVSAAAMQATLALRTFEDLWRTQSALGDGQKLAAAADLEVWFDHACRRQTTLERLRALDIDAFLEKIGAPQTSRASMRRAWSLIRRNRLTNATSMTMQRGAADSADGSGPSTPQAMLEVERVAGDLSEGSRRHVRETIRERRPAEAASVRHRREGGLLDLDGAREQQGLLRRLQTMSVADASPEAPAEPPRSNVGVATWRVDSDHAYVLSPNEKQKMNRARAAPRREPLSPVNA